jgi:hypothetical protein
MTGTIVSGDHGAHSTSSHSKLRDGVILGGGPLERSREKPQGSAQRRGTPVTNDPELQLAAKALLTTETAATSDAEQDEDDELRALSHDVLTTVTAASGDQENDPDDDFRMAACRAMLTTLTESSGDNESDPEDDGLFQLRTNETPVTSDAEQDKDDELSVLSHGILTTNTAARGDQEEKDPGDDFRIAAYRAMVTTATKASGDNESDPDDDGLFQLRGVGGDRRPLAYRFAESAEPQILDLQYDRDLQMHVFPNGVPVIDKIQRTLGR